MARPRTEPRPETDAGETGGFPSLADVTPGPLALTGLNQPLWLQNSTYPAAVDRQLIAAGLEPGVMGLTELAVTQRAAGANLSVDVAAGRVVVPMTDAPNQGSALCVSTAVNNLVVAGAPGAGLSRIDLVIARVYDASLIGGSINGWQLEIVTGTPTASPAAPALPASSIELARFTVPSGTASITTAMITDRRVMPGIWRPFTPQWFGDASNPAIGNGSLTGRYMQRGKTCIAHTFVTFGSTTNGGGGIIAFSLPVDPALSGRQVLGSAEIFLPNQSVIFVGSVLIYGANRITPRFPIWVANSNVGALTGANSAGNPGTGVPQVPSGYPIQSTGTVTINVQYETV